MLASESEKKDGLFLSTSSYHCKAQVGFRNHWLVIGREGQRLVVCAVRVGRWLESRLRGLI